MSDIVNITVTFPDPIISSVVIGMEAMGIPPGGTPGQVLVKASGGDYALEWADLPSANPNAVNLNREDITLDNEDVTLDTTEFPTP